MLEKIEVKEPKVSEIEEEKEEQKVAVVTRAVPVEDMFNHVSDKLDLVLSQQQELIKLAKEE